MSKKSKNNPKAVRGMSDILPEDNKLWRFILERGKSISDLHHFYFMETPLFEDKELFLRALGEDVEDEIWCAKLEGIGDEKAMRFDCVPPVMRSYLENQLGYFASPLRAYCHGPVFRQRPGGRKGGQFHQWSFVVIGDEDPVYDLEIVSVLMGFLDELKFRDPVLEVNSVGCKECRPKFVEELEDYYRHRTNALCGDCKSYYKSSVVRLMQCENDRCEELMNGAPLILDFLCNNCESHFKQFLEVVEDNEINYMPNPRLLGDVNYYDKVAYRIYPSEDSDTYVGHGGRADSLAESIGDRQLHATCGSLHIEKIIEIMRQSKMEPKTRKDKKRKVFFMAIGDKAKRSSLSVINELRQTSIVVVESLGRQSLESQLRFAKRSGLPLALIYGQKEMYEDSIIVRDMDSGVQESILLEDLLDEVRSRL